MEHFAIVCATRDLMSRCAKCNGEGYVQLSVDQARAAGGIQEKVLRVVTEYWQCLRCKKVYWEGPKVCAAAVVLVLNIVCAGKMHSSVGVGDRAIEAHTAFEPERHTLTLSRRGTHRF